MDIQEFINVEVETSFCYIGSGYTQVLIVENGKIRIIGEYLWRIKRGEIHCPDELRIRFAKECEKFRIGQRPERPSLCYCGDNLGIYPEDQC